ncbi:hypothetical protein B7Z00_04805 [Candidatus Saccharibacteria bacterium 32-50-10]|nr:MAG: hypothetical protein B7Z00_04805 [Candidatus Saccharibacteria bacterium 32-50-10]
MVMYRNSRGFTIIELTITIVVIAVIASLAGVGYRMFQRQAQDAQRQSASTAVAESLEKYYQQNGEYPSVRSIVNTYSENTAEAVASKLNLDANTLKMPGLDAEQPLAPGNSTTPGTILYIGASEADSDRCLNDINGGCESYRLEYTNSEGEIIAIDGRNNSNVIAAVPQAPSQPTVSVGSGGGTSVTASSSNPSCTSQNSSYTNAYSFQYRIGTGAWSAWTTFSTSSTSTIAGSEGSTYEFRVMTRCENGGTVGPPSAVSVTDSYVVPVGAPAAPTLTVALSSTNVLATATAVTCPSGSTAQYAFRSRTNDGTWGAYSTFGTGLTASRAASRGVKYGYQVQARCYSTASTSAASTSVEKTYVYPLIAPSLPTLSNSTSGTTTTYTINTTTCPSGSSAQYRYRWITEASTGSWSGAYTYTTAANLSRSTSSAPAPKATTTASKSTCVVRIAIQPAPMAAPRLHRTYDPLPRRVPQLTLLVRWPATG